MKTKKAAELIEELQKEGYFVTVQSHATDKVYQADISKEGTPLIFGVVSDTHIGSRYSQMTHLHSFYRVCQQRGIKLVLHAGDLIDGHGIYRGMEFEQFLHGAQAQGDYTVKHYPKVEGLETWVISGNHCLSFYKESGTNVLADIAERRKDIKYLGDYGAFVKMNGLTAYLHHGRSGNAYARSYRLQKLIEQLAPEQKPNLFLLGHYHCPCILPGYRNVEAVQLPCFQAQTPFLKTSGLFPFVAGLIITIVPEKKRGIGRITYEWVPYYRMKEDDY